MLIHVTSSISPKRNHRITKPISIECILIETTKYFLNKEHSERSNLITTPASILSTARLFSYIKERNHEGRCCPLRSWYCFVGKLFDFIKHEWWLCHYQFSEEKLLVNFKVEVVLFYHCLIHYHEKFVCI